MVAANRTELVIQGGVQVKDLFARHARVVLCLAFVLSLVASAQPAVVRADEPAPAENPEPARASEHVHTRDHHRDKVIGTTVPNEACENAGLRGMIDGACTHGADVLSAALAEEMPLTASTVQCVDDGVSGRRVQLVYARASDRPDTYATSVTTIQQIASAMDGIIDSSAADTGGSRRVRFVHDAGCNPTVLNVTVASTADDNFTATINAVKAQGLNAASRRYLIFMDATSILCGIGQYYNDDSAGLTNANNNYTLYARVDRTAPGGGNCWTPAVATHELMHTLGAVQKSAPHTTYNRPAGNPGGHCIDEYDIMCYPDYNGVSPAMQYLCNTPARDTTKLDCNYDDYFNTNPAAGSYLATRWNVANNQYLSTGGAPPPPPPSPTCPDESLEPDESASDPTSLTVPVSSARAFCAAGDQDWTSAAFTTGTQYTIQTTALGTTADTVLTLYDSSGSTVLATNDDRSTSDASSLITFTPATAGTYLIRAIQYDGVGAVTNIYTLAVTGVAVPTNTPPVVTAPTHAVTTGTLTTAGAIPVRITWSATDPDGISRYELQRSTNGGALQSVALSSQTQTSITLNLTVGSSYQFQVRATDTKGLASSFVAGAAFTLEGHQQTSAAIAYSGTWTSQNLSSAWGGSVGYASSSTARATFTTSAGTSQVSFITTRGRDRGRFDVYVDGVKVTSTPVDLYSSATSYRRVQVVVTFTNASVSHTVEIRVLGTRNSRASGTRVDVDGFVATR
jgi:hypothetical protein